MACLKNGYFASLWNWIWGCNGLFWNHWYECPSHFDTISSDYSPNINNFRFCQIGIWNPLGICPFHFVVVCQELLFLWQGSFKRVIAKSAICLQKWLKFEIFWFYMSKKSVRYYFDNEIVQKAKFLQYQIKLFYILMILKQCF